MAISDWLVAFDMLFHSPAGGRTLRHRTGSRSRNASRARCHRSESLERRTLLSGVPVLIDILDGTGASNPTSLTNVNGSLFFAADGGHGRELWKSDGSESGTVLVREIRDGVGGSSPASLTDLNGTLFFAANNGVDGNTLWMSDGTESGTLPVRDDGLRPFAPSQLTNSR